MCSRQSKLFNVMGLVLAIKVGIIRLSRLPVLSSGLVVDVACIARTPSACISHTVQIVDDRRLLVRRNRVAQAHMIASAGREKSVKKLRTRKPLEKSEP